MKMLQFSLFFRKMWTFSVKFSDQVFPDEGELEAKFVEIVANKKKTVALAHYIKATGRFTEAKQENNIKRANIWTKTHTA